MCGFKLVHAENSVLKMQPKLHCNSLSRQTIPFQYVIILMLKIRGCHEPYLSSRIRRYNSRKSLIHSKKMLAFIKDNA